jgi:hypothetical protein
VFSEVVKSAVQDVAVDRGLEKDSSNLLLNFRVLGNGWFIAQSGQLDLKKCHNGKAKTLLCIFIYPQIIHFDIH